MNSLLIALSCGTKLHIILYIVSKKQQQIGNRNWEIDFNIQNQGDCSIKLPIKSTLFNSAQIEKNFIVSLTLYKEAADSDSTVWIGMVPKDHKASNASKVSCHPQSAAVSALLPEPRLLQPAAATFPLTHGQNLLWWIIGSNSAASS